MEKNIYDFEIYRRFVHAGKYLEPALGWCIGIFFQDYNQCDDCDAYSQRY